MAVGAGDVREPVEEVGPDHGGRVPLRLRVASRVLAVAALALPLLGVAVAVHVLTGGVDAQYFTGYEYDGDGNEVSATTSATLAQRWQALDYLVPPDHVLLGPAAVVLLLAGLHLSGRGRPALSPGTRLLAAAAATSSALYAVGGGVVPLVLRQGTTADEQGFGGPPPFVLLVGPAGVVVFLAAACVVAGVLLLLPRTPQEEQEPWSPPPAAQEPPVAPPPDPAPEPVSDPPPVPQDAPPPPAVPRLREEDRAWYRRPAP
ncbi:hypothetical protein AB2L28_05010 [Kineococcus sp. TBRC 1896]|uniref:Uncharacterized protein n=1 Tax=Kineococcus mangrovi TaxID=1660183 RepID=A0ABV4I0P8_9ACTN